MEQWQKVILWHLFSFNDNMNATDRSDIIGIELEERCPCKNMLLLIGKNSHHPDDNVLFAYQYQRCCLGIGTFFYLLYNP